MWTAGGGVNAGRTHGDTDDYSYNVAAGGVHLHHLHTTTLHLLGVDHQRLTFRYQAADRRAPPRGETAAGLSGRRAIDL